VVHADHFSGIHRILRHPPANHIDGLSNACTSIPDFNREDFTHTDTISAKRVRTICAKPGVINTSRDHRTEDAHIEGANLKSASGHTRLLARVSLVNSKKKSPPGFRNSPCRKIVSTNSNSLAGLCSYNFPF